MAGILVVLAAGIYFTVTEKILDGAKAVRAVNAEYQSAIESAKKLIAVRDQVLRDFNDVSQVDRERLAKMIPDDVDNIRLIIDLNNIALRNGFSLQQIKATVAPEGAKIVGQPPPMIGDMSMLTRPADQSLSISIPTLDYVTVSFTVNAPYQQFLNFLQEVEANLRLMEITKLGMSVSDTGQYTYKVELKTFWLRQ